MFRCDSYTIIRERINSFLLQTLTNVYCRTVQHTDTNKDLIPNTLRPYWYIYAATPPPPY